jgi:hypothetical protein
MAEETQDKKKQIKIEISRKDGKTFLNFDIDERLEKVFKENYVAIRQSESWKDLQFYYCPDITDNNEYKDLLNNYRLFDNYGSPLFENSRFNIAFLRTIGGKGSIVVPNSIPFAVVSQGIRDMVAFIKKYYEEFMKDYSVKGFVNFEI